MPRLQLSQYESVV